MTLRSPYAAPTSRMAAIGSAVAVLIAGAVTLPLVDVGPLSLQMALHLAVMNVAAPLAAAMLSPRTPRRVMSVPFLWAVAVAQIVLLWAWHVPGVQHAAADAMGLHLVMLGSLAAVAFLFWIAVLESAATARWGAVVALLLTGKLACLLGALLIFAPRELYRLNGLASLEDQQLAGLLMITACPLSYIVAGVAMAAQAIGDLERTPKPLSAG